MKRTLLIVLLLVLILSTMAVFAFEPTTPAENDPLTNPDANACFVGGAWEGTCGDSDLKWNAGWYLIRFGAGLISRGQVPDQYKWILPAEVIPTPVPPITKPPR